MQKGKKHDKEPIAEFFRRPNFLRTAKYPDESPDYGTMAPGTQKGELRRRP